MGFSTRIQRELEEIKTHSKDYQDGVKLAVQAVNTKDEKNHIRYGTLALNVSEECRQGYLRGMLLAVKLLEDLPQMKKGDA